MPERELPGEAVDDVDAHLGLACGLDGAFAQVWLGLDGDDFVDGRGVVLEVQAVAGASIERRARPPTA